MKVKRRLTWALVLVASAVATIYLAWILCLQQEHASLATVAADRVTPLHQLFVIARSLDEIETETAELSGDLQADSPLLEELAARRAEIERQWQAYSATYLTPEEQVLAERAHALLASVDREISRLIDLHEKGGADILTPGARLQSSLTAVRDSLGALVDLQEQVTYQEFQRATAVYRRTVLVMILAGLIAAVSVGHAVTLIRRSILAPLSGARQAIAGIVQGQYDVDIPASDATEVAEFLNQLRDIKAKFSDIDRESQIERRQVSEFKARLEAVFKHCPFGIFIKDLDGRLIMVNETDAKIFGHSIDAFIGRQSADFVPAGDLNRVLETDRSVAEDGKPVVIEYRGTRETSYEWLQTVKFPIRGSGGEVVAIGGIDIDISDRKRQEATLRRYAHHIDRAGRMAKILFWVTRKDGITGLRTRDYNRDSMIEWCGWDAFPLDHVEYIEKLVHPDDREHILSTYEAFIRGEFDSYVSESRMRRKDGGYFPVRSWRERTVDPITGDVDVYALAQDISEERLREAELIAARERAESSDRAKSNFLRTMSHELRTPLNPIIGFSELLRMQAEAKGDCGAVEYLNLIHASGQHLLSIIDEILEFARLDAADVKLAESVFDVRATLEPCIRNAASRADGVSTTISLKVQPTDLRIYADESAFRRIVSNVLANSVHFTPVNGAIHVEAVAEAEAIRIAISDNGPGFDATLLAQADKPFVRGGSALSQRFGGIGLGLTTARKLMQLHGGRLEVANQSGQGARVTLIFPATRIAVMQFPETGERRQMPRQAVV